MNRPAIIGAIRKLSFLLNSKLAKGPASNSIFEVESILNSNTLKVKPVPMVGEAR